MKKIALQFSILFFIFFSGCLSYPEAELETLRVNWAPPTENRVPVSFELRYFRGGLEQNLLVAGSTEKLRNSLLASNLFNDVIVGRNDNVLYFDIRVHNELFTRPPTYGILYIISALTLFLIPGYEKEEFTMTVNIYRNRLFYKQLKSTRYKVVIYHILLLFTGITYNPASEEVISLQIKDILNQLQGDPVFAENKPEL